MNRKGQALVEFVLIMPIFILLLFAIIDFGSIISKKNELENDSVDIVSMIKNGKDIDTISGLYPDVSIDISKDGDYDIIVISSDTSIMNPVLSRILGNKYNVKVKRAIVDEEA